MSFHDPSYEEYWGEYEALPDLTPDEVAERMAEATEEDLVEIKASKRQRPVQTRTEYTPEELEAGQRLDSFVTGIDDVKVVPDIIIPGLLMGMGRTMIYAEPGSGKSAFSYRLADAVAHGDPFLGFKTIPRPVLYLDRENPTLVLQSWKKWLNIRERSKADPTSNLRVFGLHSEYEPPALNIKEVYDWALVQNPKPLIILDTFIRFQEGDEEENNGHDVKKFWERTERLYKLGCAILILHHTPKGRSDIFRGHTDIMGKLDLAFYLKGKKERGLLTGMKLGRTKNRLGQAEFEGDTHIKVENGKFSILPRKGDTTTEAGIYLEELIKLLDANTGITKGNFETLAMGRGIPQTTVRTFINDDEMVEIEVGEHNRHYLSLKE